MFVIGRKRSSFRRRVAHALLFGQILPTLLLTPSQAEAVLLHSHCDKWQHVHALNGIETTAWTDVYGSQHQRAGEEADECCETGDPTEVPSGIVLHRPPILVCRLRLTETAPLDPAAVAVLPAIAATSDPAHHAPTAAPRVRCAPRRCLDELLSGSHALLI
jgi:hypothetical protein